MNYDGEFKGKRVVVTGAAGIYGGWIAAAFAREGATLCLSDMRGELLPAVVQRVILDAFAGFSWIQLCDLWRHGRLWKDFFQTTNMSTLILETATAAERAAGPSTTAAAAARASSAADTASAAARPSPRTNAAARSPAATAAWSTCSARAKRQRARARCVPWPTKWRAFACPEAYSSRAFNQASTAAPMRGTHQSVAQPGCGAWRAPSVVSSAIR